MLPPKIIKLDETVVNRIAAGEVIQRPANALKELLENSLDAGSTSIVVTVKAGGLTLLQIQDNGCGIRKDDLGIVCERFTTSKLTKFEDLLDINTYGFRGEALSSISHVAHLTIVTKTADSAVGYKVQYEDGKLKSAPKPCAALVGTLIKVEDLFYNVTTRRRALKNPSEEYAKIYEVVSKYAIHNFSKSFTLKKEGENTSDVKTPLNSCLTDNIKMIYGNKVGKELLDFECKDEVLKLTVEGAITNANYSEKKFIFLLFINHRLVDSYALKKAIEQVYSTYLPKGAYPFVYLSINLNPRNVDVNVHPTKHEVHFLHEEAIIEKIRSALEEKLVGSNTSRTLYTQGKLPTNFTVTLQQPNDEINQKKTYAHELVRVDANEQKINKFFTEVASKPIIEPQIISTNPQNRPVKLRSVLSLRTEIENDCNKELLAFMKNFIFVGVVDPKQCLLQCDTKLYLCSTQKILNELFYQLFLYEFANLGVIKFSNQLSISELVIMYLDSEDSCWSEEDGPKSELAENMASLLQDKAAMLEDYFSIEIVNGCIASLPLVLDKHVPNMALLPDFLARVCTEVDWNLEQPCLQGIAQELARFYADVGASDEANVVDSNWKWQIEHVLIPAVKSTLLPPNKFSKDGTLLQIANLPDLYRVFERC